MKAKLFILIILTSFLNASTAQDKSETSYSMKKAFSHPKSNEIPTHSKYGINGFFEVVPVYTDNMIVDQNIVRPPGGWGNQIMNEMWAYGHFTDQYGNSSALFGNLQNALFLPHDNSMTVLAIDSRLCTILYFYQHNILAGVNHYGTYGTDEHNFRSSNAFVIGKEIRYESETDFNIFICDKINSRIVRVVYKAIPGYVWGFDGTPFDIINTSLKYPSDISYFQCLVCGPPGKMAPDIQRLWVACDDNSIHCLEIDGTEFQNIVGYRSPQGEDYYFLAESGIKLTTVDFIHTLAFVDTRRNYLVNCLLTLGGTGDVIAVGDGKYLIKANSIAAFPDDMKINSVRFHETSTNVQMSPYLWVTSGYLPPFDNNSSVLHCFKGYESGDIQYLGSTKKPNSTENYFHDLKNTAMRNGYFDLFTIEQWQQSYGVRRYLPFADIYNDTLKSYCLDSVDLMKWTSVLTNDCNIQLTAERRKSDNSWETVAFKKIDEQSFVPPTITPAIYRWAGKTNTNIQLDLPLEDLVLGGKVRLHIKLFPEYDWSMSGEHIDRNYEVAIEKKCLPKPGGCPFIYVYDTTNSYQVENNILHRSEFNEFSGQDIRDLYKLRIEPGIFNDQISISIVENETDYSQFDQIKLYAVDYPLGTVLGVSENNDVVLYDPAQVITTDSATLNLVDITTLIPYINPQGVKGFIYDSIYAHYPIPQVFRSKIDLRLRQDISHNPRATFESKLLSRDVGRKLGSDRESNDSIAVIALVGNLDTLRPVLSKSWAGTISAYSYSDTFVNSSFARREMLSEVIIPLLGYEASLGEYVQNIKVNWQSDFNLKYLAVVPVSYSDIILNEVTLEEATHTSNGDILNKLLYLDQDYAELNASALIDLKFNVTSLPPLDSNSIRDYVFEVNGKYFVAGNDNPILKVNNQIPLVTKLYNNYPNPFNPLTNIKYDINKNVFVKITIHDILGQEIATLVNEFKKAGSYDAKFDGTNLSSGVYFYRIEAGSFIEAKKMVLVK